MSLVKCKECGNDVSSQAVNCPHCGIDLKKTRRKPLGCTGAIFIFFLLVIVLNNTDSMKEFYTGKRISKKHTQNEKELFTKNIENEYVNMVEAFNNGELKLSYTILSKFIIYKQLKYKDVDSKYKKLIQIAFLESKAKNTQPIDIEQGDEVIIVEPGTVARLCPYPNCGQDQHITRIPQNTKLIIEGIMDVNSGMMNVKWFEVTYKGKRGWISIFDTNLSQ